MNTTTKARGLVYLLGLLGSGGALWLAATGAAVYDPLTGDLDILPFNVTDFITRAVSWAGNGLALLAVWRGWGK
jgi:hypothetical protein